MKQPATISYFKIANCALLGYYATNNNNLLPKFRDNMSVQSSRAKNPKYFPINTTLLILVSQSSPNTLKSQLCSSATYSNTPFHISFLFAFHCPVFFSNLPHHEDERTLSGNFKILEISSQLPYNKFSAFLIW